MIHEDLISHGVHVFDQNPVGSYGWTLESQVYLRAVETGLMESQMTLGAQKNVTMIKIGEQVLYANFPSLEWD